MQGLKIVALLPAHNEAGGLPSALRSLRSQGIEDILVMCDNCDDNTQQVALDCGAEAVNTADNKARKAGALNQGLGILAEKRPDLVLVMDADTVLHDGWVEAALQELEDEQVGAVGAVFEADRHDGWLRRCQSLEWERFAAEIRRSGKTFVLSGTAALIRWQALQDVASRFSTTRHCGDSSSHNTGDEFYNEEAITEDFDMTVCLLACGWKLRSPNACKVTTETMPHIIDLYTQRRRWSLGALQTVRRYGWHKYTRLYWRQQAMLMLSIFAMTLLLGLSTFYATTQGLALQPFWLCVGTVFAIERVVTVWDRSWVDKVFAACVLPELVYALILQASHIAALVQFITGSKGRWGHVKVSASSAAEPS